jgi:phage recombination protein Bet
MKHEITQLQPRPSVLANLAQRYSVEPAKLLDTLKQTAFKGANDAQMMALCIVADQFRLNPFTKEIYAFPDKSGGIVPVVGVDGWLRRINEHPQLDGIEFSLEEGENGKPVSCTCTIHRKDRKHSIEVTEYLSECARNTDPWTKSPRRMLRHRSLIQCARIAFGFGGSDPDEAEACQMRDVTPREAPVPTTNPFLTERQVAPPVEPEPEPEKPKRGRPRKVDAPADLVLEPPAPDDPDLPPPPTGDAPEESPEGGYNW